MRKANPPKPKPKKPPTGFQEGGSRQINGQEIETCLWIGPYGEGMQRPKVTLSGRRSMIDDGQTP